VSEAPQPPSPHSPRSRQLAVIGGGWAGLAAALAAHDRGWAVHLFEAAPQLGGRARTLPGPAALAGLDNGQHILIGAYAQSLRLMRQVGVDPEQALLRLPLTLRFPDGGGLQLPRWPAPFDAAAGILGARGWSWRDRFSLLAATLRWQIAGFRCAPDASVLALCQGIRPRVMAELIEPLCVSALNTPVDQSSGEVFLRVLRDSLAGGPGASHLLLPRTDLGALWPEPAAQYLRRQGHSVQTGQRVQGLHRNAQGQWLLEFATKLEAPPAFDQVILACPPGEAARLLTQASGLAGDEPACLAAWATQAQALRFEAITTVYAQADAKAGAVPDPLRLPHPLLTLRCGPEAPAQFVFDRGQLGGPAGLLAFVLSASPDLSREALTQQVLAQGRQALAPLGLGTLHPLGTVTEKRATFACTPGLQRPAQRLIPGLWACGDYVEGPYPATLEGAVLSAQSVVAALG